MATQDVKRIIRREGQLNLLAYTIIIVLLGISGILAFAIMIGFDIPEFWLFGDRVVQTVFLGLMLMVVLYLVDQHRRLRDQLVDTHEGLESAKMEIEQAYNRLEFAQGVAETMTSIEESSALESVLRESVAHFGAHAAAVVGEDITIFTNEGTDSSVAQSAVLQVSLDAVRAGKPLMISNHKNGSEALAVPLRIRGDLRSVVCLWREGEPFDSDQLDGLSLVARIIELSLENRLLLTEVRDQLGGTLNVLAEIIDRRLPEHLEHHTLKLADQATALGRMLGMTNRDIHELRISALLADIGMLEIPESILNATGHLAPEDISQIRLHPSKSAQTATDSNFSASVSAAVNDHHERLDGTGYPRHRKGEQIALPARIIAVCDVFNALTSERPHRPKMSTDEAMAELIRDAGRLYDPQVVRALMKIVGYHAQVVDTPKFTKTIAPEVLAQAVGFDS